MSFYGNIKRINSSPYVFDKVYPNRAAMDSNVNNDNIYIGRYVLVKYTYSYDEVYNPVPKDQLTEDLFNTHKKKYYTKSGENTYTSAESATYNENTQYYIKSHYFDKYDSLGYENITSQLGNGLTYKPNTYFIYSNGAYILDSSYEQQSGINYYRHNQEISEKYGDNANTDINTYHDTYDATVWQKIYTTIDDEPAEKYILVAELNAAVPRLELSVISPKEINAGTETWNEPAVLPQASTEDAYTFQIPDTLHLDVGNMSDDFYGKILVDNPATKYLLLESGSATQVVSTSGILAHDVMLSTSCNYMIWRNEYKTATGTYELAPDSYNGPIDGKKLDTKLYAFGQLISDLYDALYGVPSSGAGRRPFYTESLDDVLTNYDKGLIGILSSIATEAKGDPSEDLYGRELQPGMYYYFTTKWCDALENPDNFIENIPEVIGSADELTAGKSHYKINFAAANGQYVVNV